MVRTGDLRLLVLSFQRTIARYDADETNASARQPHAAAQDHLHAEQ